MLGFRRKGENLRSHKTEPFSELLILSLSERYESQKLPLEKSSSRKPHTRCSLKAAPPSTATSIPM